MIDTIIWIVAYMAAGFRWVWRDQRRQITDRKAYVRSALHRWITRFVWLPLGLCLLAGAIRRGDWVDVRDVLFENLLPSLLIFAVLALVTIHFARG